MINLNIYFKGGLTTTRKMAKKSQPAALQAEVSTDEEWEKILEKNGLLGIELSFILLISYIKYCS